jgi:hypothetical protein
VEGFNPTRFARLLATPGGPFAAFSRSFTAEGDTRPGAKSGAVHKVARGWVVTDAIVDEFKQMLIKRGIKVDESSFKTDLTFIKAEIKYEVDSELFGQEESRRRNCWRPRSRSKAQYLGFGLFLPTTSSACRLDADSAVFSGRAGPGLMHATFQTAHQRLQKLS